MRWSLAGFGFAALMAMAGGAAEAGVVVTEQVVNLSNQSTSNDTVFIDSDRMKAGSDRHTVIFRGDLQRMWMIDEPGHSYREITPGSMQAMQDQAHAAMDQRLANLPEAQRKQVEAMMAQKGGGGMMAPTTPSLPPSYRKLGETKTIAGYSCELYHREAGGEISDVCIARLDAAGLSRDDFRVFAQMLKFLPSGGDKPALYDLDAQRQALGFDGLPLETLIYTNGKPFMRRTVTAIQHSSIPGSTFELPPGFAKQDLPSFGVR